MTRWAELPKVRKSKAKQREEAKSRSWEDEEADVLASGVNTRHVVGKVSMVDTVHRGFGIVDQDIYVPMWCNVRSAEDDWNGEAHPLRVGDTLELDCALRPQGRNKWSAYKAMRTAVASAGTARAEREHLISKHVKTKVDLKKKAESKKSKSKKMKGFEVPTATSIAASVAAGLAAKKEAKKAKRDAGNREKADFAPVGADNMGSQSAASQSAYLGVFSGEAALEADGVARGVSAFGSVSVVGVKPLTSGKWYYEAELLSDGVIQIGWADHEFTGGDEKDGDGVGDDAHSWAFDGCRGRAWTAGDSVEYGAQEPWKRGDVIGCFLDADTRTTRFSLNGRDLGLAFDKLNLGTDEVVAKAKPDKDDDSDDDENSDDDSDDDPMAVRKGFFAAVSLEDNEAVRLLIHKEVMRFPPTDHKPLNDAAFFPIPPPNVPASEAGTFAPE